ncbi:DNA-binding response regulator [Paenibacillus pectinilyticus]|uniref:DNA-binding response regulator n=1 Tax=Paenibacillus pectinilyticus TaxID=512399 RepID=A0A1C0ZXK8_9BACL|nr:response regulator [Paenibacillus pectinilyticus]OCT12831.1 DNA-binding response regulator [Paenibacillus pectinilyticus]
MKIVVVDDEKGIVDGLQKMIGRYIPECEIVGVAYNGMEGAKLIQERQPDIVISDIRMPQADGLYMIQMLKELGCQAKFILLSGYADFEYARRGMQLGVKFYLNKPVEEEELRDCVCKVMDVIREEHAKLQEVDELKQEVNSRLMESALRDIIEGGSDHTVHAEELLQTAHIPMDRTHFVCALLEFESNMGPMMESGLDPVFRHVDRTLGQYQGVFRFRYLGSQVAMIVTHDRAIAYEELVRDIQRLKDALFRELKLSVTIGIGTVIEKAAGIHISFEEARHSLSYKIVKGSGAVIAYPDILTLSGKRQAVPEDMINKLEACLDNMDEEACVGAIREIFQWLEEERELSPVDLQLQCLNILLSSARKLSLEQLQQNDFLGRNLLILDGLSRYLTLDRMEAWMNQMMKGIIAFKLEHNISKKKDVIAEIKDYVSKHYAESISLAELSARFYINPYYLSQLFKQKTGDTYLTFLAQTRINKSKELLEKTDLKVYEICQMVGYSDSQHFAKVFEKLTGCKPSEYRKNPPIP